MKITIIYGSMRHGSTYNCVNILKEELGTYSDNETVEFFLPKDMPHFCNGCFSCLYNGEDTCPHYESMKPIVEALENADLIILASPVYCYDVSAQMKVFLDHLSYIWLPHRPRPSMFKKIGIVISTAAGIGMSHTNKTMKKNLQFWGVKKVFSYGKAVAASKWEDISTERQQKIRKELSTIAKNVNNCVRRIDKFSASLFIRMFFAAIRSMMKKNKWGVRDHNYWQQQGWLDEKSPF